MANTPARKLVEMLGGPECYPAQKMAYAMKAMENLALMCTPESYYLPTSTPQQRLKSLGKFNNGKVVFAVIGATDIEMDYNEGETCEVKALPQNQKSFIWLPNYPFDSTATTIDKKKGIHFLHSKFHLLKKALQEYHDSDMREVENNNSTTMCSSDALSVVEFFTSKEPTTKVKNAYEHIASLDTDTDNNKNARSGNKRTRKST